MQGQVAANAHRAEASGEQALGDHHGAPLPDAPLESAPSVEQASSPAPAAAATGSESGIPALFSPRELALGATARDRLWGWLGPLLVTALGGLIRFINLGHPRAIVFDETYYVKDAYTLSQIGYDAKWPADIDQSFAAGNVDQYLQQANYTVHPPVGKWLISLGIDAGGVDHAWAWRLATAVLGTLMIFILARTARRILASTALGTMAGGLLAVDGLGIVMSRTAILDGILAFFVVVAFACLIADRTHSRRRMQAGRPAGMRWWLIACGVALGLATGTKWSGVYFAVTFGIAAVAWDWSARRTIGAPHWLRTWFVRDAVASFFALVPTLVIVYVASWWSWFTHLDAWGRRWAAQNPAPIPSWLPDSLLGWWNGARSFIHYHSTMLTFHENLETPHRYQSNPWLWPIQARPTSFYWEESDSHQVEAVLALGNPLLWWLGAAAFVCALWFLIRLRDWRAGAVVAGYVGAWVPWLFFAERTIFNFYMVVLSPFVALAFAYGVALLLERCDVPQATIALARRLPDAAFATRGQLRARQTVRRARRRRRTTLIVLWWTLGAIALVAVFFYPLWTGVSVPYMYWLIHMWSPTWI
ncbi:dolichyl-phosphate-mannose--protein mannosyltransferase [Rarobacter incanus]|uniref:dolichyl-phosphate-mannose--protein mannosyltransferase n=1 Tax=Rarobacter incanus TaxID=153494 RepID=UPI0014773046|nr:phospholipid carrier-dependent glycosyltransferase [Rarobacter incanus]